MKNTKEFVACFHLVLVNVIGHIVTSNEPTVFTKMTNGMLVPLRAITEIGETKANCSVFLLLKACL